MRSLIEMMYLVTKNINGLIALFQSFNSGVYVYYCFCCCLFNLKCVLNFCSFIINKMLHKINKTTKMNRKK